MKIGYARTSTIEQNLRTKMREWDYINILLSNLRRNTITRDVVITLLNLIIEDQQPKDLIGEVLFHLRQDASIANDSEER